LRSGFYLLLLPSSLCCTSTGIGDLYEKIADFRFV